MQLKEGSKQALDHYFKHLGHRVESVTDIGTGFHATGYKIILEGKPQALFLRVIGNTEFGHDLPAARLHALIESSQFLPNSLPTHTILGLNANGELVNVPNFQEVMSLGDFLPAGSQSFCEDLRTPTNSEQEAQRLAEKLQPKAIAMATALAQIHSQTFEGSLDEATSLYKRSLRTIIHGDELAAGVKDVIDFNSTKWITHGNVTQLLAEMEFVRHKTGVHPDRLRQIHGDYWASNVYFCDNSIIITDGRLNWGEPAIDVGWMVGEFAMQDLIRFGAFGNAFTETAANAVSYYIGLTGDTTVTRYMSVPYAFQAFAESYFTPRLTDRQRRMLFLTARGALRHAARGHDFNLDKLNEYAKPF